jgi:hypothetical protein
MADRLIGQQPGDGRKPDPVGPQYVHSVQLDEGASRGGLGHSCNSGDDAGTGKPLQGRGLAGQHEEGP